MAKCQLAKLRATGAFLEPTEIRSNPKPRARLEVLHGEEFVIDDRVDRFFWPYAAWLKLKPFDTRISYLSMLEKVDRNEAMFFGLEAYLIWRERAGALLLGWVDQNDLADAAAELTHLELVRTRLFERFDRIGIPSRDLQLNLAIASRALEFEDVRGHVEIEPSHWIGPSELVHMGTRLDLLVEAAPPPTIGIDRLVAAAGVLLDHEFPSRPLTPLPARLFPDEVSEAA